MDFKIYEHDSDEEMRTKIAAELVKDNRFRKLLEELGDHNVEFNAEMCSISIVTSIRYNKCVECPAWGRASSDEQTRQLILNWLIMRWKESLQVEDAVRLTQLVYTIFQ